MGDNFTKISFVDYKNGGESHNALLNPIIQHQKKIYTRMIFELTGGNEVQKKD